MSDLEMRRTRVGSPIPPQYHEALAKVNPSFLESQRRNPGHEHGHLLDESPHGEEDPFLDRPASNAPPTVGPQHSDVQGSLSRANVVPLSLLKRWPACVECPVCRELTHTNARIKTGHGTHWMATLLFFTTGVGAFVPYMTNFSKNY
ncbi:hypothetical protein VMCG_04772 [Cytospora schulzeri]|uniref:LITAF domain-containing protein n=1 Tax=Cytospora schulzeri TaxID=448051 RepID=A0A423WMV5_9PEZI|nr:hypothetical protein VMCG_04772 [Valsa malicola]